MAVYNPESVRTDAKIQHGMTVVQKQNRGSAPSIAKTGGPASLGGTDP
jgi:hypothetical protein